MEEEKPIIWWLEKSKWPRLDRIVRHVDNLTPEDLLENEEFLEVASVFGGYGHPRYPRNEVEFEYFKGKLVNSYLVDVLKSLENPPPSITLTTDRWDLCVEFHPTAVDDKTSVYWEMRLLMATGAVGGVLGF